MIWWHGGGGLGGLDTPENDDVIYEQPLIVGEEGQEGEQEDISIFLICK